MRSSRLLNDKSILFGLDLIDLVMIPVILLVTYNFLESFLFSILSLLLFLGFIIPLRLTHRKYIIFDSLFYLKRYFKWKK